MEDKKPEHTTPVYVRKAEYDPTKDTFEQQVEQAKLQGWRLRPAGPEDDYPGGKHEQVWILIGPETREIGISCSPSEDEASVWKHVLRHFVR
jgi:hypothetical protein